MIGRQEKAFKKSKREIIKVEKCRHTKPIEIKSKKKGIRT